VTAGKITGVDRSAHAGSLVDEDLRPV